MSHNEQQSVIERLAAHTLSVLFIVCQIDHHLLARPPLLAHRSISGRRRAGRRQQAPRGAHSFLRLVGARLLQLLVMIGGGSLLLVLLDLCGHQSALVRTLRKMRLPVDTFRLFVLLLHQDLLLALLLVWVARKSGRLGAMLLLEGLYSYLGGLLALAAGAGQSLSLVLCLQIIVVVILVVTVRVESMRMGHRRNLVVYHQVEGLLLVASGQCCGLLRGLHKHCRVGRRAHTVVPEQRALQLGLLLAPRVLRHVRRLQSSGRHEKLFVLVVDLLLNARWVLVGVGGELGRGKGRRVGQLARGRRRARLFARRKGGGHQGLVLVVVGVIFSIRDTVWTTWKFRVNVRLRQRNVCGRRRGREVAWLLSRLAAYLEGPRARRLLSGARLARQGRRSRPLTGLSVGPGLLRGLRSGPRLSPGHWRRLVGLLEGLSSRLLVGGPFRLGLQLVVVGVGRRAGGLFAALDVVRKVAGENDIVEQGAQWTLELLLHLGARLAHVVGLAAGGNVGENSIIWTLELVLGLILWGLLATSGALFLRLAGRVVRVETVELVLVGAGQSGAIVALLGPGSVLAGLGVCGQVLLLCNNWPRAHEDVLPLLPAGSLHSLLLLLRVFFFIARPAGDHYHEDQTRQG